MINGVGDQLLVDFWSTPGSSVKRAIESLCLAVEVYQPVMDMVEHHKSVVARALFSAVSLQILNQTYHGSWYSVMVVVTDLSCCSRLDLLQELDALP